MKLHSVQETAERLGVGVSTLYDLARRRKIAHHRIGVGRGRVFFSDQDIDDFLVGCRVERGAQRPAFKFTHAR